MDLSVVLLHENMLDKTGKVVTTSLTIVDIHDIARSSTTFGLKNFFIAHPATALRKLAEIMTRHWSEGFGSTYNPKRKTALSKVEICINLDEVIEKITKRAGKTPKLIATSAKQGANRISYSEMAKELKLSNSPYLLMLGTGWGMTDELMSKADYVLDPILGPGEYNHLSVRSACAIMLDRLFT